MAAMRVLITGCAGFIGSNLTQRCIDEGWETWGVDDLSNGHREFLPSNWPGWKLFLPSDFAGPEVLRAIQDKKFDVIFHLAAVPRVSYSVKYPLKTHDVNVTRTLELLNAARDNVKRVVFASSSSVYGGAERMPTPEDEPRHCRSPYALQKSIIEDYLALYASLYGLDSVALRFFNVFGPHQLGDSPYATAVSAWLDAIKRGRPMRSDGDGTQTRDMCYVDNVVQACVLAATVDKQWIDRFRCYNVACGDRTANFEISAALMKRFPQAQIQTAPWRPGDVMHTQADISKISRDLGYVPRVRFWEGLDRTIDWYERSWSSIKDMKLHT